MVFTPSLDKPSVPIVYAFLIFEVAAKHGVSRERILEGAHIPEQLFSQPDALLTLMQVNVLFYKAIKLTERPGLGYEMALQSTISSHGFLGYGVMSCASVRDVAEYASQYSQLRLPNLSMQVFEHGDFADVEVRETIPQGQIRTPMFDLFMIGIAKVFQHLLGLGLKDSQNPEIWFDYPEPPYFEQYADVLPNVTFNKSANLFRFRREVFDQPLETANAVMADLVKQQCEKEAANLGYRSNTADIVRVILESAVDRVPSLSEVAAQLHVSNRTLSRRLKTHGVSFQHIVDDVRRSKSLRYLLDPTLSVEEISSRLGYADSSNFSRAFRGWQGCSPVEYRQRTVL